MTDPFLWQLFQILKPKKAPSTFTMSSNFSGKIWWWCIEKGKKSCLMEFFRISAQFSLNFSSLEHLHSNRDTYHHFSAYYTSNPWPLPFPQTLHKNERKSKPGVSLTCYIDFDILNWGICLLKWSFGIFPHVLATVKHGNLCKWFIFPIHPIAAQTLLVILWKKGKQKVENSITCLVRESFQAFSVSI